jgi:hypothetical protein
MDEVSRNAVRILSKWAVDIRKKLDYADSQRRQLYQQYKQGAELRGYRVEWISQTATDIWDWLAIKCDEFNAAYPQDRATAGDLLDILSTAVARLKAKMENG